MVRRLKNEGGDAHCKATAGATTATEKPPYKLSATEKETLAKFKAADETRGPRLKVQADGATATFSVEHPNQAVGILAMMRAIGTTDPDFYDGLMGHLVNASRQQNALSQNGTNFLLSVVKGIEPRDQVEAMLAAQMAAVHVSAMTFARRLAHVENIPQQDSAERAFNKLTRTFASQMEALKRYRTGGEQKVTVQHVTVGEGGQAIVGNVTQDRREGAAGKPVAPPLAVEDAKMVAMPTVETSTPESVPVRSLSKKK